MNIRRKTNRLGRFLPVFFGFLAGTLILLCLKTENHISTVIIPKIVKQINCNAKPWLFPEPRTIKQITQCVDKPLNFYSEVRGKYYVFYNYVAAEKSFNCDESVTFSAPADFTFLDNVLNLVAIWKGPISVALYSPGEDFFSTVDAIAYLRVCSLVFVREWVTFHLFFDNDHVPVWDSPLLYMYEDQYDCHGGPPWQNINRNETYRALNNLTFPINVARNIAKVSAQTHFIFPSDIELYPSDEIVENFLDFVTYRPGLFSKESRNVFVLAPFEVAHNYSPPMYKVDLQGLVFTDNAVPFHEGICSSCHKIPSQEEWIASRDTGYLDIFSETKRQGEFVHWEPFFICTQREPLWDERLSWEGQGDKMSQAYSLCLLDYNFLVLNNAFVVHRPGIKQWKELRGDMRWFKRYNEKLVGNISKELQQIYGVNEKCEIKKLLVDEPEITTEFLNTQVFSNEVVINTDDYT